MRVTEPARGRSPWHRRLVATALSASLAFTAGCTGDGGGGGPKGMVEIYRARSQGQEILLGYAVFGRAHVTNLGIWSERPGFPADEESCGIHEIPAPGDGTTLDAGPSIQVDGPAGSFDLVRTSLVVPTYAGGGAGSFFVGGGTYQFSSSGGDDVAPFDFALEAPNDLIVSAPAVGTTGGALQVFRDQNLPVEWLPSGGQPVFVAVSHLDTDLNTTSLVCRFADDGSAVVPAEELSRLPEPEPGEDYVHVFRNEFAIANVEGGGPTAFNISTTWRQDATLH